jgi:hypothetical protein
LFYFGTGKHFEPWQAPLIPQLIESTAALYISTFEGNLAGLDFQKNFGKE